LLDPNDGVGARYARYFTMKNEKKVTIYDLFFATNHWQGIDAMKEAMWNVDQSGAYSFSDATNPDQEVLFTRNPEWGRLFDLLTARFAGTEQPWAVVSEAVRNTPFRILKTPFKDESNSEKPRLRVVNPEGVRKGKIDDALTRISFV
jgi:hypothetical protein